MTDRRLDAQGRVVYPTEPDVQARLKQLRAAGVITGYTQTPDGFVLRYNPEVIR